jgi:hypothetical protein
VDRHDASINEWIKNGDCGGFSGQQGASTEPAENFDLHGSTRLLLHLLNCIDRSLPKSLAEAITTSSFRAVILRAGSAAIDETVNIG